MDKTKTEHYRQLYPTVATKHHWRQGKSKLTYGAPKQGREAAGAGVLLIRCPFLPIDL